MEKCKKMDSKKTSFKNIKTDQKPSEPIVEFPHILRIIGPKHIKIMMGFVPSAVIYSVTSLLLVSYMADWRTVLQYLPYYNGKYQPESTESKQDDE